MRKLIVASLATLLALPTGGHLAVAAPVALAPSGPRLLEGAPASDVIQVQTDRRRAVSQQHAQRQRVRVVRQQRRNNAAALAAGAAALGIIAGTALAAQRQRGSRVVCDEWGRCFRVASRRAPVQYYDDGYYDYVRPAPRVFYRQHYGYQPHYAPYYGHYGQRRITGRESPTRWRSPQVHHAPAPQYVPGPNWQRGGYAGGPPPAAQAPDPTVSRPGISLGN